MTEPLKIFCGTCHAKLDVSDFAPFDTVVCPECGTKLRVPMRFDRYLLEKVCGKGGMSVVYRAIEPELSRRVAVKIFAEHSPDGKVEERFVNEARLITKIKHPGVIPVYQCGCFKDRSFLAMRFMEHGDLERMMLEHRLPELSVIAGWLAQIVLALQAALALGIVHHDIKPSNIMLTAENEAKLGDFDLADYRKEGDFETQCGEWGSPAYVSPERLMHGGEDHRGDIFSMGVTIYELFTGAAPFGLTGDSEELYERRKERRFQPLRMLQPDLAPEFVALVDAMLEFRPEDRPDYPAIQAGLQKMATPPGAVPPPSTSTTKTATFPESIVKWFRNQ